MNKRFTNHEGGSRKKAKENNTGTILVFFVMRFCIVKVNRKKAFSNNEKGICIWEDVQKKSIFFSYVPLR